MARNRVCLLTLTCVALGATAAATSAPADEAKRILEATGVRGGLIVHLGCGDGTLTAALRANGSYLVHGLARDPRDVAAARERIRKRGLYGKVSVDRLAGKALPYADSLVNLLVAEEPGEVPMAEVLRVLRPLGVAYVKQDGQWRKTVKPWPEAIDEWSHFLHDASNNAVARDTQVGPPRHLQWTVGPRWLRSHEYTSSMAAMVSAGGRVFYVFDEGVTSVTDPRLPERWVLIARDAFNGVLLWRRPLPEWRGSAWRTRALRGRPASVPRRIVADAARLYATFSHAAPLAVLDAATGTILRTVEGTENTQEILLADGSLVLRIAEPGSRREPGSGTIAGIDAASGKTRWRVEANRFIDQSLAAANDRVIFHNGKETVCLRLADGKELWRAAVGKGARGTTFIVHGGLVLAGSGRGIVARSAETGKVLWTAPGGGHSMRGEDFFIARGCAWHAAGAGIAGYDLATGKPVKTIDPSSVQTPGHHLRCYRAKATERFLITQYRGIEFVSLTEAPHAQNDWIRGACGYGVIPCNGLLYVPPDPCFCYPGAKLTGFLALAPEGEGRGARDEGRVEEDDRLEKGPAYGSLLDTRLRGATKPPLRRAKSARDLTLDTSASWPTYRHDSRRSGSTASAVPSKVATRWETRLRGELAPPVVAGGRVFVAVKDEHTLYALGLDDGGEQWHFTAGGRIDSPPTIVGALAVFGCGDGCVYCLRASDGALAWRFQAAPSSRRIVAFGHVESPWRVHGSMLLENGLVYGTAGRSSFLEGGIRLFALDPTTGRLVHEARLDTWSPTREDARGKPFIPAYHMEGAQSDILVSEGGSIYLGMYQFDRGLARQKAPYVMPDKAGEPEVLDLAGQPFIAGSVKDGQKYEVHQRRWLERTQKGLVAELREEYGGWNLGDRRMGRHVFATAGFLDDAWYNRTYWMYSETWPGYYLAHRGAKTGQLLVVGPEKTYAVQAFPTRNLQSPLFTPGGKGYLLFADRNANEPVLSAETRGTTKGWGFTRTEPPVWHQWVPVRIRAMVLAGPHLFVAGPPDVVDPKDPMAAFEGRKGAVLKAHAAADGKALAEHTLDAPPVFDGLIAAAGRLFLCTTDGRVLCLQ